MNKNKEYIERESVIAFLENMAASKYLIQCFESKERFPAADVKPVQYGMWKVLERTEHGLKARCSNCGYEMTFGRNDIGKYCSNCGAKMNKE